jgi:uncharacterized protein (DUF2461 family)
VQLNADAFGVGCGRWEMSSEDLQRYREAVDDDRSGRELVKLVAAVSAGGIEISGHEVLKTAPRGYPKDHPRIELLRYKGLIAWREWPVGQWLGTKRVKDRVIEFFDASAPLDAWLDRNV